MTLEQWMQAIARRRTAFITALAVGSAGAAGLWFAVPPTYNGVAQVLMVNENTARDPSIASVDMPSVATSTAVLDRVWNDIHEAVPLIHLKKTVSAKVAQRSSLMAISYSDPSADLAVDVPNAVADEVARYYREISTRRYVENVRYLKNAMIAQRALLKQLQQEVQQRAAAGAFSGSAQAIDNFSSHLADLNEQRALAYATVQADAALATATASRPLAFQRFVRHELLQSDNKYATLADAAAKDYAALSIHDAEYTGRYPGLPNERLKVAAEEGATASEMRRALGSQNSYSQAQAEQAVDLQKARAALQGDRAKLAQIDGVIAFEKASVANSRASSSNLGIVLSDRDAAAARYQSLSDRLANALANSAEAASLGTVVVVDRALIADTQRAVHWALWVVAFAAVLASALGLVYAVETLDPRLIHARQIEDLYGKPVIATIR